MLDDGHGADAPPAPSAPSPCPPSGSSGAEGDTASAGPPRARSAAEQCEHVAQEGSLAWGNRCVLRNGHGGAHLYGTAEFSLPEQPEPGLRDAPLWASVERARAGCGCFFCQGGEQGDRHLPSAPRSCVAHVLLAAMIQGDL